MLYHQSYLWFRVFRLIEKIFLGSRGKVISVIPPVGAAAAAPARKRKEKNQAHR